MTRSPSTVAPETSASHSDVDIGTDWLHRSYHTLKKAGMLDGIGYWELDLHTCVLFWSDETCCIHGLPPGYVPSLDEAINFYAPEARDKVRAGVEAAIANGTSWQIDLPLIRADGMRIWVQAVGEAIQKQGRTIRLQGAFQDITSRKTAEIRMSDALQDARNARNRLNTLANNAPGALFERALSPSGQVYPAYFSAQLPELLGVSEEELVLIPGAGLKNIVPEDRTRIEATIRSAEENAAPAKYRYRLNHPQKGQRWIETSTQPGQSPGGGTIWFGSLRDVTDEMATNQRLSETLDALHLVHDRLNRLAENIPGGLFEYRRAADGSMSFPYFTSKFAALFDLSAEDLKRDARLMLSGIPLTEIEEIQEHFKTSQRNMSTLAFRHRVFLSSGEVRWLQVMGQPCAEPDGACTWYGKTVDITEHVEAEARTAEADNRLVQAHNRINTIMEIAPVGLYEFHRSGDGHYSMPFASTRCCDLLGFSAQELAQNGICFIERIHKDDAATALAAMKASEKNLTRLQLRFRYLHPQFGPIWLKASSIPHTSDDDRIVWIGAIYDVTPEVKREAELVHAYRMAEEMRAQNEHLALHDALTNLPNRRHYERVLEARMSGAKFGNGPRDCTLIQIDIDHFKQVNDSLGHETGDRVLADFAEVLRGALRPDDFAARLGGDEFSIVLAPESTVQDARSVVERLRKGLRLPLEHSARITASFGIVHASDVSDLNEELQSYTDAALYRAKEAGRNRVEVFSGDLSHHLHDTRWLVGALRHALDSGQLEPWFQPQISAQTGALVGIEALVRWRHPTRGILGPDLFMKTAEQLRLVPEIDRLVMEKSRVVLEAWRERGLVVPKISFNVSAERVREAQLIGAASQLAHDGTRVALELVETIRAEEEDGVFKAHLSLLRAAGIDIEIDDFGSGHTSIIGLMEVRPSALKIDRRLVMAMDTNLRAAEMVRTIVQMAGALGIATIAEGVETETQAAQLRAMGCDELQGFLFARPLDADALFTFALDRIAPGGEALQLGALS